MPLARPNPEPVPSARPTGLIIRISRGTGTGPTSLAAFDAALRSAGVADFNLVRLSSIIPPGSVIHVTTGAEQIRGGHGDRLFCVYSEAHGDGPGEEAWAGLMWARHDQDGPGLLVEQHDASRSAVEQGLRTTLDAMIAGRHLGYRYAGQALSSITYTEQPVCALVVATYQALPWAPEEVR